MKRYRDKERERKEKERERDRGSLGRFWRGQELIYACSLW